MLFYAILLIAFCKYLQTGFLARKNWYYYVLWTWLSYIFLKSHINQFHFMVNYSHK